MEYGFIIFLIFGGVIWGGIVTYLENVLLRTSKIVKKQKQKELTSKMGIYKKLTLLQVRRFGLKTNGYFCVTSSTLAKCVGNNNLHPQSGG